MTAETRFTRKTGTCRNCHITTEGVLHRQVWANGAHGFLWVCARCNAKNPFNGPTYVAHTLVAKHLTPEQVETLPILMPEGGFTNRCTRCGTREAELHHWAPRAFFGDKECEQWPKDYLCTKCHGLWHSIVTPQTCQP